MAKEIKNLPKNFTEISNEAWDSLKKSSKLFKDEKYEDAIKQYGITLDNISH